MPASKMRTVKRLPLLFAAGALAVPGGLHAAAGPWVENPECRVRLVSPYREAPAEGELRLGLEIELAPGWHSYWKNSGDAGYPPEIDLSATPEITDARLLWPAPERYELPGELVAFGYEEEVIYPLRARLAAGGRETLAIEADVDYVVCEVECIPYRHTLTLEQPLAAAGEAATDPEVEARLAAWEERLPRSPEELPGVETAAWLVAREPDAGLLLRVEVRGEDLGADGTQLFLEAHELFDAGAPRAEPVADGVRFEVALERRNLSAPLPPEVEVAWTVTGLSVGGEELSLEVRRRTGTAPPAAGERRPGGGGTGPELGRGILLPALGGGLLLALTPGALALFLLAGAAAGRRDGVHGRRAGALAAAAGALAGGLLLAAAALAAGGGLGWGAQFERPGLLTAALVALLLLALHLWGLVPLRLGSRWSLALAGLAAALLALPFDPPGLAPAAGAALARGAPAALAAGAASGIGLAAPYLLLAAAPGLGGRLPALSVAGPGRPALGFLPAAGLVWGLYLLAGRLAAAELAFVELALLVLALFAWLWRRAHRGIMRLVFAAAVVLAGVLSVVLAS